MAKSFATTAGSPGKTTEALMNRQLNIADNTTTAILSETVVAAPQMSGVEIKTQVYNLKKNND